MDAADRGTEWIDYGNGHLLPTVLPVVHGSCPALGLPAYEEQTASLPEELTTGRLDLRLPAVPLGVTGVQELPLFDEDFVPVTRLDHSPGGRQGTPAAWREALRELDLLLDEGHWLRDRVLGLCREDGRADAPATTTAARGLSTSYNRSRGLGVTLPPRTALKAETGRSDRLLTGYFSVPAPEPRIAPAVRVGSARGSRRACGKR